TGNADRRSVDRPGRREAEIARGGELVELPRSAPGPAQGDACGSCCRRLVDQHDAHPLSRLMEGIRAERVDIGAERAHAVTGNPTALTIEVQVQAKSALDQRVLERRHPARGDIDAFTRENPQ